MARMDRDELLDFHKKFSKHCLDIMKRKNSDYTGDNKSPFANFEACEDFGICSAEEGFMVRIMDKMKRINTFVKKGELKVKDEPVKDAITDIINYMVLLAAYLKDKKDNKEE